MSKTKQIGTKYGYTEEYKEFFFKTNPTIPRYSFQIRTNFGKDYWYASRRDENGKRVDRYLGSCFEGIDHKSGNTSFQQALNKLIERFNEGFILENNDNRKLQYYVGLFIQASQRRLEDVEDTMFANQTILQHINSIKKFKSWLETLEDTFKLGFVKNEENYRKELLNYVGWLKEQEPKLSISTIRTYIKNIKTFHLWLSDSSFGGGFVKNQPITQDWLKMVYRRYGLIYTKQNDRQSRLRRINRDYFSKEGYEKMITDCIDNIRDIWTEYNKHGEIPREFINQPKNQVGSRVVYFVSLYQLVLGFRVGEILTSFRSVEDYDKYITQPNQSGTFWYKQGNDWIIEIDWKGKSSVLPTSDLQQLKIRTWDKPIHWKGKPSGNNGKQDYYDTHLTEVCMILFEDSPFLFTAYKRNDKHYSYSQYNNNFKEIMIGKNGWNKYGVETTHDLRHYFINHHIKLRTDPMLISQITRHSLTTMLKFYKEENVDFQKDMVREIGIQLGKYKPLRKNHIIERNES